MTSFTTIFLLCLIWWLIGMATYPAVKTIYKEIKLFKEELKEEAETDNY